MKMKFRRMALGVFSAMLIFDSAFSSVSIAADGLAGGVIYETLDDRSEGVNDLYKEGASNSSSGAADASLEESESSDNGKDVSVDNGGNASVDKGEDSSKEDSKTTEKGSGSDQDAAETETNPEETGKESSLNPEVTDSETASDSDAENLGEEISSDPNAEGNGIGTDPEDNGIGTDLEGNGNGIDPEGIGIGTDAEGIEDAEDLLNADPNSGKCGDNATWKYDTKTKTLTISGSGRMYDYEITDMNTQNMGVNTPWFQYAKDMTYVNISDDITYIGVAAFAGLRSRQSEFTFPSKLKEFGKYAFYHFHFEQHATVILPGTVKEIPDYCFFNTNAGFGTLVFSEGIETIGYRAFQSASFYKTVWADSVTTIGEQAFDGYYSGPDFVIPKGIKKIGKSGFNYLQHVRHLTFEGDLPQMEENAFGRDSVIAFYNPNNKTFSESARNKAAQYFADVTWRPVGYTGNNKAGANITWRYDEESGTLRFEGEGAMSNYTADKLPDWFLYAGKVSKYYFDQRITEIGDYTFYNMGDFRGGPEANSSVVLPKKLKRIGKYAFYKDVFYNVTMPETVEVIDDGAFRSLQFWDSTVFPRGVKWIGDDAFNATGFRNTEIVLDSIEHIGAYGLALSTNCDNDTMSYEFPSTLKYIGDYAFGMKVVPKSSRLTLPSGMEYIGAHAFSNKNLTGEVVYPSSVTQVKDRVFSSTGIESVVFDKTLEDAEANAFKGMSNLKKLTFKGSFPNLKKDAFYNLDAKLTVYYPFDDETWLNGIASLNYKSDMVEFVPVGSSTTVTFVGLDGKVVATKSVAPGGKVSAPSISLKSGQELGGWYTSKTIQYEGTKWNFDSPVRNKMTLYAALKYSGHRVVFYPLNGKAVLVKTVADGKTLADDSDVKKLQEYAGYRFLGWYSSKNYANESLLDLSKPVDRDVAVYAMWTVFRPYVYCNNDRYAFIGSWQDSYEVGEAFDNEPWIIGHYEEDGYAKFLGWYYDKDFKKPVTGSPKITKDIAVYGKWDIVKHKVTFNLADDMAPIVIEVEHWDQVKRPEEPVRTGFTFKGWASEKNGKPESWYALYNVQKDMAFYAVWEAKTISINYWIRLKGGGWTYYSKDIHAGEKFIDTYAEYFEKDLSEKYDFEGWFLDEKLTKPITTQTVLYESTKVYGKVTPKLFTVTLNPDNGEKPYVYHVEWGEGLNPIIPVKKGYEFTGWTNDAEGSTSSRVYRVYGNCSYTARWSTLYHQNIIIKGVSDQTYTGKAITFPNLRIQNGSSYTFQNGKDFTVKYKNNVKAGVATIEITYKGNYRGKSTVNFNINKADLNELKDEGELASSFDTTYLAYNKKVQKAKPQIAYRVDGKVSILKENRDYKLVYPGTDPKAADYKASAFKETGTYKIKVVGIGNFSGELSLTEVITADKPVEKLTVSGLKKSYSYTGSPILPHFVVKDGKTVVGEYTEDGFVSKNGLLDCSVSYNTKVGTGRIHLTANKGSGYAGSKDVPFNITGTPISKAVFDGFATSLPYNGGNEVKQASAVLYKDAASKKASDANGRLKEGTDYTVKYSDNKDLGKATVVYTGIGAYAGEVKKIFIITGKSLKKAKITGVVDGVYTGDEVKQEGLTVLDPVTGATLNGIDETKVKTITPTKLRTYDYVVSYKNNKNTGTATVIATGINGYTDKVTSTFRINKTDISKYGTISCSTTARYRKKVFRPDNITVKAKVGDNTKQLVENTDYTVKISYDYTKKDAEKGTIGEGYVVVTGKGRYAGSIATSFGIKPGNLTSYSYYQVTIPAFKDKTGNFVSKVVIYDDELSVLRQGVDYKLTYTRSGELDPSRDKLKKGESFEIRISGIGNFGGGYFMSQSLKDAADKKEYMKKPVRNISSCTFTLRDYIYNGKEIKPNTGYNLIVMDKDKLVDSVNYEIVGYENNIEIGTATMIIRGRNNYKGTYRLRFRINPREVDPATVTVQK
jgi:uncharacterized repeat protein (TIGR02543 family)